MVMAGRAPVLDAFRGLAVLLMLQVHLGFWWARSLPEGDPLVGLGTALGGMAAPIFFTVAGSGLALSYSSRPGGFLGRSLKRGAALIVTGVIFTHLEMAVYGPLGWGVLQSLGVSVIVCAAAMRLGPAARTMAGMAIMAVAPLMRHAFGIPDVLFSDDMMNVSSAAGYAQSALLSGFFPLIPWMGLMLVGTSAGQWLFPRDGNCPGSKQLWPVFTISGFSVVAGVAGAVRGLPLEFFPPSLPFCFLASGICLAALTVARLPDVRAGPAKPGAPLVSIGRLSLTIFLAHHFIGYNIFLAAGLLRSIDLPATLAMVLVSWALTAAIAVLWAKKGFSLSLEWLLGRLEGRPSK
jgi:uncharacterized membrane protein